MICERRIIEGIATRDWYYRRFGVDETPLPQADSYQASIKDRVVQSEPNVTVTQQRPGVDFIKGGSIHF